MSFNWCPLTGVLNVHYKDTVDRVRPARPGPSTPHVSPLAHRRRRLAADSGGASAVFHHARVRLRRICLRHTRQRSPSDNPSLPVNPAKAPQRQSRHKRDGHCGLGGAVPVTADVTWRTWGVGGAVRPRRIRLRRTRPHCRLPALLRRSRDVDLTGTTQDVIGTRQRRDRT